MTSRPDPETPVGVVDLDVLERNLDAMAAAAARAGLSLRPHAKTHKCPDLARLQLERGAIGLSVATVGEAEVFADHGVTDLFVAYPVWPSPGRARRLGALDERCRLAVGVDSVDGAAALGRIPLAAGHSLSVLVEVDSGHHRSGVPAAEAAMVATAAARGGLHVAGVFTFPGHGYAPGAAGAAVADDERVALERARDALIATGHEVERVSGGSTPTAQHTLARPGPLTELRPGVYAFNDAQQVALGSCTPPQVALTVRSTVVSAPTRDRIVLDAGSKMLGADRPSWVTGYGLVRQLPGATIGSLSEHHAVVTLDRDGPTLPVGDQLAVIPNHCCTAVNLTDRLVVVRGDAVVGTWDVAARGANT